jgi:CDP-glucose 4,6-dehydratase
MHNHHILLTGASGFTGSWLVNQLAESKPVVTTLCDPDSVPMRGDLFPRTRKAYGSVLDYEFLVRTIADHGIDTVFHLAAISVEHKAFESPRKSFEVNIRGTYNLLEACRINADLVKRVIVASSDKVYGDNPSLPYREDFPVQGLNPYDASKSCGDLLARSYYHSYGLPVAVARFANIYGGGDLNWSRLIPNTIRRLLKGEPPLVRWPLLGVYKRDFLYIKDQVQAYMALFEGLTRPEVRGQAYNFGGGVCLAVPEVVKRIQRLMGREETDPVAERGSHSEILHQQLLSEKASRDLGWAPRFSIDEGLSETVAWYTRFLSGEAGNDVT